jgi:hypothetical protein
MFPSPPSVPGKSSKKPVRVFSLDHVFHERVNPHCLEHVLAAFVCRLFVEKAWQGACGEGQGGRHQGIQSFFSGWMRQVFPHYKPDVPSLAPNFLVHLSDLLADLLANLLADALVRCLPPYDTAFLQGVRQWVRGFLGLETGQPHARLNGLLSVEQSRVTPGASGEPVWVMRATVPDAGALLRDAAEQGSCVLMVDEPTAQWDAHAWVRARFAGVFQGLPEDAVSFCYAGPQGGPAQPGLASGSASLYQRERPDDGLTSQWGEALSHLAVTPKFQGSQDWWFAGGDATRMNDLAKHFQRFFPHSINIEWIPGCCVGGAADLAQPRSGGDFFTEYLECCLPPPGQAQAEPLRVPCVNGGVKFSF